MPAKIEGIAADPRRYCQGTANRPPKAGSVMRRDLVERARDGDHEAFVALTAPAFHRLYAVARRILRDADLTDDAVQECLYRAWRDIKALRDPERFDAWLHRLLVNARRDLSRHRRKRSIEVHVLPLERAGGRDAAADLADRDQLERGFLRLRVEQRSILVLHLYLGLPAVEIAELLGLPSARSSHASTTRPPLCAPFSRRMR